MLDVLQKDLPPSKKSAGEIFTRRFYACLLFALALLVASSGAVSAQQRNVSGTVRGEGGTPLIGVTVLVKGTSTATATDVNGGFSLPVTGNTATLVFSYIGYLNQEVAVGSQSNVSVTLLTDAKALEEVVVVGYGTQNKRDLTGSVASLNEKDFNAGPITSPLQQINGRAAGVTINQVGNEPGQAPSIRIRGITSLIGGNDPLVVVDGIQGDLNLLKQIPPSEIESIEILKDASATAIYGSRGAAGVVLVSTKKGRAGETNVEYSGTASLERISKSYDLLSASEYRAAAASRGVSNSYDYGGDTDWLDAIIRAGSTTTHNLAVSGGNDNFSYRTSLTGIFQQGIIKKSNSENYIARFQGTQKAFKDKLALTFNLNTSVLSNDYNNGGRINDAINRRPTDPIYVEQPLFKDVGNYFIDPAGFNYLNPVARTMEIVDRDKTNNQFGSLRAEYNLLPGLTATAFGSWRRTSREYENYSSARTTIEGARNIGDPAPSDLSEEEKRVYINNLPDGIASKESNGSDERLFNFMLNYKKDFGDHSIDVIGVNEWQKQVYNGFRATSRGFLVDNANNLSSLQSADPTLFQQGNITSYKNDRTLSSFLGRVNYSYKDRYLFSASFRRDGSSVFGANNKWANFYAVSGAWRIIEEGFMSNLTTLTDLKIRVGYGETGNQQGLGPLNSVRLVNPDGTVFFGGSVIPNFSITQNENRDLRWEVKKMFNAGVDFGLFENKLTGSIDGYYGLTSDLLFDYSVPQPPYPFGSIKANIGEIMNKGLEASLSYALIDREEFGVTLAGNVSTTKTEINDLNGSLNGLPLETNYVIWGSGGTTGVASTNNAISHLIIGQPLGTFYLFKHAGVDAFGNQIVDDLNNDGIISDGNRENPDRYIAGQALPKVTWAFTPSARYRRFDLNMVVRGAHGHKIFNARRATLSALGAFGQNNMLKSALEDGINSLTYATDYWLEDGDFARLENLTIGYNVNSSRLRAIKNLRLSFTANNLFVITGYSGIDPELSTNGSSGFGIDYGIYPRTRSFAFGVNATF
ncbi:SusC/RagA family TonB-linked outer membrane protein [Rufibacter ruber]|uniref:SusC/RagA family TonB-linked outer membrane protein n=1 Tax=Rufibacter ruber TaxID=1783499 RepID=UPI00082D5B7C|nr:TonB-dependent receptor [Rufibacter ruber]